MRRLLSRLLAAFARPKPIWRGVYARRSDVPARESAVGEVLVGEMAGTVANALKSVGAGIKPYLWHEHLALVAAIVAAPRQSVRVLDFGGGPGSGFVQLVSALPPGTAIDYTIIDLPQTCAAGKDLFAGDGRIRFSTEFPEHASAYDIVYVNSALQYVDEYADMLQRLAALRAPWLLLARLAAGTAPTFASQQVNVPGQTLPYWFLNVDEVSGMLKAAGYDLACDFLLERVYDQSNLPAPHRAERMRTMLFARRAATPSSG